MKSNNSIQQIPGTTPQTLAPLLNVSISLLYKWDDGRRSLTDRAEDLLNIILPEMDRQRALMAEKPVDLSPSVQVRLAAVQQQIRDEQEWAERKRKRLMQQLARMKSRHEMLLLQSRTLNALMENIDTYALSETEKLSWKRQQLILQSEMTKVDEAEQLKLAFRIAQLG